MKFTKYKNYKIIPFQYYFSVQIENPTGTIWKIFANVEECKKYIDIHILEIANRKKAKT